MQHFSKKLKNERKLKITFHTEEVGVGLSSKFEDILDLSRKKVFEITKNGEKDVIFRSVYIFFLI